MRISRSQYVLGWLGVLLTGVALSAASALAGPISLGIEPIIGYERVQKLVPTQHTTDRLMYGARATLGVPLIAAEVELTRGTDTESFADEDLTVKDVDDKLKLGLRSSLRMSSLFRFLMRAGAQAKRNTHEETTGGSTSKTIGAITYKPYGGLGFTSRLGRAFELSGTVTAVFNEFPNMRKNEYQTAVGFNVRFP